MDLDATLEEEEEAMRRASGDAKDACFFLLQPGLKPDALELELVTVWFQKPRDRPSFFFSVPFQRVAKKCLSITKHYKCLMFGCIVPFYSLL